MKGSSSYVIRIYNIYILAYCIYLYYIIECPLLLLSERSALVLGLAADRQVNAASYDLEDCIKILATFVRCCWDGADEDAFAAQVGSSEVPINIFVIFGLYCLNRQRHGLRSASCAENTSRLAKGTRLSMCPPCGTRVVLAWEAPTIPRNEDRILDYDGPTQNDYFFPVTAEAYETWLRIRRDIRVLNTETPSQGPTTRAAHPDGHGPIDWKRHLQEFMG